MSRRLVLLAILAAAAAGLVGCSDYPDPLSGRCPTLWELRIQDITATSARLTWETDRLSIVRIKLRPHGGLERLIEEDVSSNLHDVTLTDLFPETDYEVEVIPAAERLGGICADSTELTFRTDVLPPSPDPERSPVGDPDAPPPIVP